MSDVFDTLKQMRQDFQEDEKYHNEDSRKTKEKNYLCGSPEQTICTSHNETMWVCRCLNINLTCRKSLHLKRHQESSQKLHCLPPPLKPMLIPAR